MFNIKKKRIIRKIFFIIIFIYNEKFILNAAESRRKGRVDGIDYQIENREILMAETFRKKAKCYEAQAKLLKAQNHHQEAEEMNQRAQREYQEEAYCRARSAQLFFNLGKMKEAAEEYCTSRSKFNNLARDYTRKAHLLKTQNQNDESEEMLQKAAMAEQEAKKTHNNEAYCRKEHAELLLASVEMEEKSKLPLNSDKIEEESELLLHSEKMKKKAEKIKAAAKEYFAAGEGFVHAGTYYAEQAISLNTQNRYEEAEEMFKAAEMAYRKAKKAYENQAYWLTQNAELLLNLDKMKEAAKEYYAAGEAFYNLAEYNQFLAAWFKERGDIAEETKACSEIREAYKNSVEMQNKGTEINNKIAEEHYNKAECHKKEAELFDRSNEEEKAEESYKKMRKEYRNQRDIYNKIKNEDNLGKIYSELAETYEKEGNMTAAEQAYKASGIWYDNITYFYKKNIKSMVNSWNNKNKFELYYNIGDLHKEIAIIYGNASESYTKQKKILCDLGNHEEARKASVKIVLALKNKADAYYKSGNIYNEEGNIYAKDPITHIKKTYNGYDKSGDMYFNEGSCYKDIINILLLLNEGDTKEIKDAYEKIEESYKEGGWAYLKGAVLHIKQAEHFEKESNFEAAEKAYWKSIRMLEKSEETYHNAVGFYIEKAESAYNIYDKKALTNTYEKITELYNNTGIILVMQTYYCTRTKIGIYSAEEVYQKSSLAFNNAKQYYEKQAALFETLNKKEQAQESREKMKKAAYNATGNKYHNKIGYYIEPSKLFKNLRREPEENKKQSTELSAEILSERSMKSERPMKLDKKIKTSHLTAYELSEMITQNIKSEFEKVSLPNVY